MSKFTQQRNMWEIILIVAISVIVTAVFILWVLPEVSIYFTARTANELIAIVAVLVSMIGVTWQIIWFKLRHIPQLNIELNVEVLYEKFAIITSKIENTGGRKVTPNNVYLFIDEGILKEGGNYEFPFLLKHEAGEYDCVLSEICQREKLAYPKDLLKKEFHNIHTDCVQLRHLSSESILYVGPGESFSEDVTVELPHPGVYRAMLVFTAKDADCICSSKQFIIQNHQNQNKK